VTGNLRLQSALTNKISRLDVSNSSQAPRFGISLALWAYTATGGVALVFEIHTRRADSIEDDRAIVNKGTIFGHEQNSPMKISVLDFARGFDQKSRSHFERRSIKSNHAHDIRIRRNAGHRSDTQNDRAKVLPVKDNDR